MLLNLLFAFAHAEEHKAAFSHLQTKCKPGFELNLGDNHREPDSESQEFGFSNFWIIPDDGAPVTAPITKESLLFIKPKNRSVCKDTVAFAVSDGTLAIFLKQNNHPFNDKLAVTYYDPRKQQILAYRKDLGPADEIEKTPAGPAIRIHDGPTDLAQFKVKVRGHESTTAEEIFDYWQTLRRDGDKVVTKLDRKMTWNKSPYRPYFKSRNEFEAAFGEGLTWVYRVKQPDCVQPTKARKATSDGRWFCR